MELKSLDIDGNEYIFESLEQLVEMLKDDNYEISLYINKKDKIRGIKAIL